MTDHAEPVVVHGLSPWGFPCPMTRSAEWRATHDRFATCHCGATPPDHAVDNASRPWDATDDAGHEHRVAPEEG